MRAEYALAKTSDAVQNRAGLGLGHKCNAPEADRSGLLDALDRAVARGVIVISAPAGTGKTSLLRDVAQVDAGPLERARTWLEKVVCTRRMSMGG